MNMEECWIDFHVENLYLLGKDYLGKNYRHDDSKEPKK